MEEQSGNVASVPVLNVGTENEIDVMLAMTSKFRITIGMLPEVFILMKSGSCDGSVEKGLTIFGSQQSQSASIEILDKLKIVNNQKVIILRPKISSIMQTSLEIKSRFKLADLSVSEIDEADIFFEKDVPISPISFDAFKKTLYSEEIRKQIVILVSDNYSINLLAKLINKTFEIKERYCGFLIIQKGKLIS